MIPIAVVLLLIVAVFSIAVVVSNPGVQELSIFGASIPVNDAGVYFTGAGAMLVLILALGLLRTGARRELVRRKEIRALKSAAGDGPDRDADEKDADNSSDAYGEKSESPSLSDESRPADISTEEPKKSSLDLPGDTEQPETTAAERQALLDETDELTGDQDLSRGHGQR